MKDTGFQGSLRRAESRPHMPKTGVPTDDRIGHSRKSSFSCNRDPRILEKPENGHLPRRASDVECGWPKREPWKLQMAEQGKWGCSSSWKNPERMVQLVLQIIHWKTQQEKPTSLTPQNFSRNYIFSPFSSWGIVSFSNLSHIIGIEFESSSIINTSIDKIMNPLVDFYLKCVSYDDLLTILLSNASDELQNQFRGEQATHAILIKICLWVFIIGTHQTKNNLSPTLFLDANPCHWPWTHPHGETV